MRGFHAAVAATAFVALAGCSAIPPVDTVTTQSRPAISNDAAQAVIKHYTEVNNTANHRRDDKLIATVEGGNLVRQSHALFTIDRATDKAGKNLAKPISFTNSVVGAPSYGGYPMRFVTKMDASNSKDYLLVGVWERASAGSPWLHTFSGWVPKATKLPELKELREVTSTDASRWVAAPGTLANQLADYLTVGAKSPYAATFAPSKDISELLAEVAEGKSMVVKYPKQYRKVTNTFKVTDPPASFATSSGELLVFVTLTDEYEMGIGEGYKVSWSTPDVNAFSPATTYYENVLSNVSLHDVVLVVPPKGSGKVRVVSFGSQLIDAGGY
ncbi:hypothetical protein ACWGID_31655 [Kribbella sp. NPDC054772]